MKMLFKILVWSLGLVAVVVVAAAIALPLLIDPNDHKDRIVRVVEAQTGRELSLQGDIVLSVFPWLGFDLGAASLGNAPGFGAQPFATIKRLRVGVAFVPLLRAKVEMGTVSIHDLSVHLVRNQKGASNWADLVAGDKGKGAGGGLRLAALAFGGLDIRNASLTWEDQLQGQAYAVKNLNLETGVVRIDKPLDFSLAFQLQDSAAGITGDIALDALLDFRPDHNQYRLRPVDFNARLKEPRFPSGSVDIDLKADIAADLQAATARVSELSLRILGAEITGDGQATKLRDDPELQGSIQIAPFDLRELLAQIGQELPKTADPQVLKSVELSTPFISSKRGLSLKAMQAKLDDSQIKGDLSITNFSDPDIGFNLDLDRINVDRYLPPQAPKAITPETVAAGVAAEWPSKILSAMKLKGDLRAGHLTLNTLPLSKVAVTVRARDGRIALDPVSARLFGGSYEGKVAVDATGAQPRITVDSALDGVPLAPLLEQMTGGSGGSKIDGRTTAETKLTATGASAQELRRTLTGDLRFELRDGAIRGFNIARILREVKSQGSGTPLPPGNEPVQTDFSEMTGTAHLANGLVSNKDLVLKSPLLRAEGSGHANLTTEQVDYRINATLVDTLKSNAVEELKGIPIPVRVSGTFDKLKFTPDLQGVIEARAKKELGRQKDKVQAKLQKKLGKELSGKFSDLLGSKPKQEQAPPQNNPSADRGQDPVEDVLKDQLKRVLPF